MRTLKNLYIEDYPQPLHKKFDNLDEAVSYFNKYFRGTEKGESGNQEKVKPTEEAVKKKEEKGVTYYAVAKGHKTGVFTSWEECKKQTTGFKGAKFKKFDNEEEATMFAEGKTLKQIGEEEAKSNRKREAASSSGADTSEPQKRQKK
ncbi:hypothetical protein TELCIR_02167 [Teladorsagia circumcincta]|uniref:ribonuclease H n=1 Tax=Teladorsagia circumcincta TaxID=45464 RepID=A0A2G9V1D7_TELCI|nr:hypothetical protein TELCIR_02167 [Teladorsagia circumcincta]